MKLKAGETKNWPEMPFKIEEGAVLLKSNNLNLLRLDKVNCLPGLNLKSSKAIGLHLQAITDCTLYSVGEDTAMNELEEGYHLLESITRLLPKTNTIDFSHKSYQELTELLMSSLNSLQKQNKEKNLRLINAHIPLNQESSEQLLIAMHESDTETSLNALAPKAENSLWECIQIINPNANPPKYITGAKDFQMEKLSHLLECANLIGREVVISPENLEKDCGDLIAFLEEKRDTPILLKSTNDGYKVWSPELMLSGFPIKDCEGILERINRRAISVTQNFREKDLTTLGLLRFTYGEPKNITKFVVGGLLLGILTGFLLAIGREVGAARWIFGMGISGVLIGTCLGFLSKGFRLAVGVSLLATLLALLTPTFNTVITNQALPDRDLSLLLQISLILIVAGITRVSLGWVQSHSLLIAQQKGAAKAELASMDRLLQLPIDFFQKRNVGDLQLRFDSLDELRQEIQALLEGGLFQLALTSIYILFMLRISVKLTGLSILIAALILLPTLILALQSRPLQRRQEEAEGQAQSRNLELIGAVSKLRIAGAETRAAQWWAEQYKKVVNLENLVDAKEATATLLQDVMPNLGTLLLYIVITKLISEATLSQQINAPNVGQLLGFFSASGTFIGASASLSSLLVGAFDMPIIYERAKPILKTTTEATEASEEAGNLRGDVLIDRISYRYSPESPLVLKNININIKAGEFIAIVGESGSGKSTLVRLLLGFSKPEDGSIYFDGQPLSSLKPDSIRRQIGTVMQTSTLFSGTLMEAIAGGAVIQEEEAWHAAELAGLAEEISTMPMGLQTMVPEGGGTLSGGQKQRVAIARALVRKPRILIFDEATSALDNRTQATVSKSLEKLAITRIVIAHRLSTIRNADKIIVISRGEVEEQGNYETLMKQAGLFSKLMQRQLS